MSLFLKAFALASLALAGLKANAANFNCEPTSGEAGGQVHLTTNSSLKEASFVLIKGGVEVGRIDFRAPPVEMELPNIDGNKVPFLRYYDSIQSVNIVVTSLLYAEKSLLTGQNTSGLVIFQQQKPQQYLCQLATK